MPPPVLKHKYARHKLAGILLLLLISLCLYAVRRDAGHSWQGLMIALPSELSTAHITSISFYILKQTHEPVFRRDDGENYTSRILTRWSRRIDYSQYTLCPDTRLSFDHQHPFSFDYFKGYIAGLTLKYAPTASVSESSGCFVIDFHKPVHNFMDFLSSYENAPSIKTMPAAEEGLGPFAVVDIGKDRVVLKRKKEVPNGFNRVILYDYKGAGDPNLQNRSINDFNFIPPWDRPGWAKQSYRGFKNLQLKTQILLLNIPDSELRSLVYNCIDIDKLRRSFFPRKDEFYDVQTLLPVGMPGAMPGKAIQRCMLEKTNRKMLPLVLLNWRNDNFPQMHDFAEAFNNTTGIPLIIKNVTSKEFVSTLHTKPHKYSLAIITNEIESSNPYGFFTAYFGKENRLDFDPPDLSQGYNSLMHTEDPEKRSAIAASMAGSIASDHAVLPLYQGNDTLLYPSYIKNLTAGREFLEYPEIGDFRW